MPPDVYLGNLAHALGELEESVESASTEGLLLSSASALREAGFSRHHRCAPRTTAYELARRAVAPIGDRIRSADVLVYATSLPVNGNVGSEEACRSTRDVKHLMDFPASRLQADLDLGGAMVLGINQLACTALLAAIRVAAMALRSEQHLGTALCVTADRFPDGALYEQAYNLISDGAAACLVTRTPAELRILGGHGITNGAMAFASDDQTIGSYFTYTHRLITELLARHGLGIGDIQWIVPQNINTVTWKVLSSLLRFDPERVLFPTMPDVGHMISGDNIVNLQHLLEEGRFASGDRILMPMAGYGLNWQCLLLEKV